MSLMEKQAKISLLNLENEEVPSHYDPFHVQNILKDCQNSHEIHQPRINKAYQRLSRKKTIETENQVNLAHNNRQSLKKLLRKLEQMPSPQKKPKKSGKMKTVETISTTEPLLQIKQCFRVKSAKKDQQNKKDAHKSKKKNLFSEDEKIRNLIKQKMQLKKEHEAYMQAERGLNYYREESKMKTLSRRNSCYRKSQSKRLINFLI